MQNRTSGTRGGDRLDAAIGSAGLVPRPAPVASVRVWTEELVIPTYLPASPDKNPMFLEKRVYQGSSGRVYPLPFTDRISVKKVDRKWKALWIENEFLRALVLPEIGGRIHAIQDKTNGYDLIYHQRVIKPALVGLAGPWVSGGIEFNWPQHHRPSTFLPVDFEVEEHADGSKTIWCGDHDPMSRMKGLHGVCLHPGRAWLELKVRVYNRTPLVQTFLWWANVATRVHEAYQSFFPPDVHCVADHARRSMSEYPLAKGVYYGVNYGERGRKGIPANEAPSQFAPPHCRKNSVAPGLDASAPPAPPAGLPSYAPNDLSFYANIPTPCSYMCTGSSEDFFGGYDYAAQAGIIHIANHHIAPGKKQWTWGNHEFGYAWDRNLTERDARGQFAPYIEIMAGVYTDNQPDFSFLQPGETKTWSQYWCPIQKIGPAQAANLEAAISLRAAGRRSGNVALGVAVTRPVPGAVVQLEAKSRELLRLRRDLVPGAPFTQEIRLPRGVTETDLRLRVAAASGRELIAYAPVARVPRQTPPPATEPSASAEITSADELYFTGLHLEQYRHATRCPTLYWREALRRDAGDARCNNAMGRWHLRRGEFAEAERYLRKAIKRITCRNANPYDGEAYYNLGLCLRYQAQGIPRSPVAARHENEASAALLSESYGALYKATWNLAWAGAGYHALAEIDCTRENWAAALEHLNQSLRRDTDNLRARNLKVLVLRRMGEAGQASSVLRASRQLDRLDIWARHLDGEGLECDLQTRLDLAHDYARAGFLAEAVTVLQGAPPRHRDLPDQSWGALPLIHYTLGWLEEQRGNARAALAHYRRAAAAPPDYCFPARLEELAILEAAMRPNPGDARAPYYLGNLLYDRRRHEEAIRLWERSARLDPAFSIPWRNLGIGYFNVRRQPARARAAYERGFKANPTDARLLYERDQLWKRLREKPERRLRELEDHLDLVWRRDDLSVELGSLYNQTGRHEKALALLGSRKFQPWEGGEGGPLGEHVRAHLALGRQAMAQGDAATGRGHFLEALTAPDNLGEARHLLDNQSDIHFWLGCALSALGRKRQAREHWLAAARFKGDFQEMSVRVFSEKTYYSALSWKSLGQKTKARMLLRDLLAYAGRLQKSPARIDYFATSLSAMLLFEDDLQFRQETTALFLRAQALLGLGQSARAKELLRTVLARDPNHPLAADLVGSQPWERS